MAVCRGNGKNGRRHLVVVRMRQPLTCCKSRNGIIGPLNLSRIVNFGEFCMFCVNNKYWSQGSNASEIIHLAVNDDFAEKSYIAQFNS